MTIEKKILVIIPAYNEEGSVGKVIEDVRTDLLQADILVVSDGSTDCTSEKARAREATVLELPFNLGIGGAMQAGYQYACQRGYDIAIQVDADGQHDPKEIAKLLRALEEKKIDVALGSRFIGDSEYKSSTMRRIGISIFSQVISMIVGQKIQIIVGLLSLILLLITFELIRKKRLREEYAILWLFTGIVVLMLSLWPEFFLSQFFARITGIFYLSAIVVIAFLFLLLIVLHFSVVISKLTNQNKELAQRYGLLELEINELKRHYLPPRRL